MSGARGRSLEEVLGADVFDLNGVLDEPVEQHASSTRTAPVEPESDLVEVVREMLLADTALKSTQQPSLQQGSDPMGGRHQHVGRIWGGGEDSDLVSGAEGPETGVRGPSVRIVAPPFHKLRHKAEKALGRHVGHMPRADASESPRLLDLDSDGDEEDLLKGLELNLKKEGYRF